MEWEEPTNPSRNKAKYAPAFDALKDRPMEWGKVGAGLANRTQLYRLRHQYGDCYDVVTQPEEGGTWAIYARYHPHHDVPVFEYDDTGQLTPKRHRHPAPTKEDA